MATKESMMGFISGSPKHSEYVPYVSDTEAHVDTAPKLEILSCPAAVNKKLAVISGTLKDDASHEPRLFINQKEVNVRGDKWLATVPINEGINHIVVLAMNNTGKNVFASRDVFCGVLSPRLEVDDLPELTSKETVIISGTVTDTNPGASSMPEVSINGSVLEVDENGKWSCPAKTVDGENVFIIAAKNGSKTPAVVRKAFIKAQNAPEFYLEDFSESSPVILTTIKGTLKPAEGSKTCWLRVNDQDVPLSQDGSFTTRVKLRQSNNPPVSFTVTSDSKYTLQRQINFDPPPPVNTITKCETAQKRILYRIAGTATDETGAITSVSLNGKEIAINKGAWNTVITVKFGFTPLVIITKNAFGKTSALLGCIYLEQIPPELKVTDCPETIKAAEVTITGTVKDPDAEMSPVIFVNSAVADIKGEEWSATIPLIPGSVNPIKITAKSDTGKVTEYETEINCTIIVPSLKVLNCPRETSSPELVLRGFARSGFVDNQNDVNVYINNNKIDFAEGKWMHSVTLKKGKNVFWISARNKDGERVEVEKVVTLL